MLDTACEAAENAILDQRVFYLNDEEWAWFNAMLDAPPEPSEALKRLMRTPAPWER